MLDIENRNCIQINNFLYLIYLDMPRKLQVVDSNEPVAVNVEANPVVEFPNSEPLPNVEPLVVAPPAVEPPAVEPSTAEPVLAVKKRAPRARTVKPKKDLEPVQEEIPVEVKVEEPPPPPPPPPAVVEEPVEEPPKKNVKTVELVECEKCGKKLTQRTLKYSHPAVCPKNDPPPESTQKPKKQRSAVEAPPQEVEARQALGMVRRVRKNGGLKSCKSTHSNQKI